MGILSSVIIWYKSLIPYAGFLALSILQREGTGKIAFTGWLAAMLYMFFYIIRYQSRKLTASDIVAAFAAPAAVLVVSLLRGDHGFGYYFIELTLIEAVPVNVGLAAAFLTKIRSAKEDGMSVIIMLAVIFVIGSSLAILIPFGKYCGSVFTESNPYYMYLLVAVIAASTADHARFFVLAGKGEITLDDDFFEDHPYIIIAAIAAWMGLIPLISFIIRRIIE